MIDKDGKMRRGWITKLKLSEVSGVFRGANKDARVALYKSASGRPSDTDSRAGTLLTALLKDAEGIERFGEIAAGDTAEARKWRADASIWPLFVGLQKQALETTTDQMLGALAKTAQVGVSVGQFMAAVREKFPAVEAELAKLLATEDENMKTAEQLQKELDALTAKNTETATASAAALAAVQKNLEAVTRKAAIAEMSKEQREYFDRMPVDKRDAFADLEVAKRDEFMKQHPVSKRLGGVDDEELSIGTIVFRKSEVGETAFRVMKLQQASIGKLQGDQDEIKKQLALTGITAEVEKLFSMLPGKSDAKADAIKAMRDKLSKEQVAVIETMLVSGQKALNDLTKSDTKGRPNLTVVKSGSAEEKLNAIAKELVEKAGGETKLSFAKAYDQACQTDEGQELYKAYLTETESATAARG